jgi:CHAD domain-containing protein
VATRRIRSDLRTFRPLLDAVWTHRLRQELSLLATILGAVRDGDVLHARMQAHAQTLSPQSARGVERVLAALASERDEAHAELLAALRSKRYLALLDSLVAAANAPALLLGADLPAATVLPGLVRKPWRSLAKRVRTLGDTPADEELHVVRIRTKRVRYAAEAVSPLVGRQARGLAARSAALQEVLGDLNDAVVAERWLREWAGHSRSIPGVFAAGELAGLERAAARTSRKRWRKAWQELSARELRAWM